MCLKFLRNAIERDLVFQDIELYLWDCYSDFSLREKKSVSGPTFNPFRSFGCQPNVLLLIGIMVVYMSVRQVSPNHESLFDENLQGGFISSTPALIPVQGKLGAKNRGELQTL